MDLLNPSLPLHRYVLNKRPLRAKGHWVHKKLLSIRLRAKNLFARTQTKSKSHRLCIKIILDSKQCQKDHVAKEEELQISYQLDKMACRV